MLTNLSSVKKGVLELCPCALALAWVLPPFTSERTKEAQHQTGDELGDTRNFFIIAV